MSGGESNPAEGDGGRVRREELFISYSQKDRDFLEQFWIHLSPLEEDYGLQRWDDSRLRPGDLWLKEIEQALGRAQVALLLVSPNFLASAFIRRKELPALFEAAEKDGLTILWLPIRPCSWKRHRQIEQYQAVGSLEPTLAEMDEVRRDREMVKITDRIHDLFERIQNKRQAAQEAAEAEALAQRQEDALRLAEQEAQQEREERGHLERLRAEREARAEAERWKAEAERLAEEAEQLAREKEELQRQVSIPSVSAPQVSAKSAGINPAGPLLIQIPTSRGWLEREGNSWQVKTEAITVNGYKEELAPGIALMMVQIPAGTFDMGSPKTEKGRNEDEGPQHPVTLRSFFLGQTVVTQEQWSVVAGWEKVKIDLNSNPSRFEGKNSPVEQVNWFEAMEFCNRLNRRFEGHYTLPSEAQWEYACRAGTTTPFHFGETLSTELANYNGNLTYGNGCKGVYRERTMPVAQFPANAWGLQDMHGNVWEWCADHWHSSYDLGQRKAPNDGSPWEDAAESRTEGEEEGREDTRSRVLRGGSWIDFPVYCRSAYRNRSHPALAYDHVGFRVCCLPRGRFSSALEPLSP